VNCSFDDECLTAISHQAYVDWETWTDAIARHECVLALDAPLGQPRAFVEALGFTELIPFLEWVGSVSREDWVRAIKQQPIRLGREVDRLASAGQAMNVDNPPVGKMFHAVAPRLVRLGFDLRFPSDAPQQALEAYPALVARKILRARNPRKPEPYKGRPDAKLQRVREEMMTRLPLIAKSQYGFSLEIADDLTERAVIDTKADILDSILCAIQGAWAIKHAAQLDTSRFHVFEGTIFDPDILN
jgi:hypothetical protein